MYILWWVPLAELILFFWYRWPSSVVVDRGHRRSDVSVSEIGFTSRCNLPSADLWPRHYLAQASGHGPANRTNASVQVIWIIVAKETVRLGGSGIGKWAHIAKASFVSLDLSELEGSRMNGIICTSGIFGIDGVWRA